MKIKCANNNCLKVVKEKGLCPKCTKLINSGTRAKKAKPIKKESDKRRKQNKEYLKIRAQFLKDNPKCAVTGKEATEVHHKKGRTGNLLTDVRYFLPVSREAHQKIELNPDWAKEQGYSLSRLSCTE
jgi:hypothetical protein